MPAYVYFARDDTPGWGRLERAGDPAASPWEQGGVPCADTHVVPVDGPPFGRLPEAVAGADPLALGSLRLLAPCRPTKIVCVGRNYRAHAAELGNAVPDEPLLFLKPPSALNPPGAPIRYPVSDSELVHHEGELGVVIGTRCRRVAPEHASRFIAGYTLVNDVTARDLQRRDGKFTRGKGFDSFCPAGPALVTDFEPLGQRVTVHVRGPGGAWALRQDGPVSDMIFDVPALVAFVSRIMTLEPGDLLATGTPEGVGPLAPGGRVRVAIAGLGCLESPVVADP